MGFLAARPQNGVSVSGRIIHTLEMLASHRTQGATLIVSLLFVMLILAVIMAVTAQVTLSTRRSTVDQQRLLSARYAAESGVAQVQSRLRVMKALLDASSIPPTVGNSQVEARIRTLCGVSTLPPATLAGAQVCTFPGGRLDDAARMAIFRLAVGADTFARKGFRSVSDSERDAFWTSMFSGAGGTEYSGTSGGARYQARFGLAATELRRYPGGYRLYFTVPPLTSAGSDGPATQRVQARATASSADASYFLSIGRPSFATYALFTNHHFQSPAAEGSGQRINFTKRTLFSGPVHTNQRFLFEGDAGGQPIFWGEVTSAGCPDGRVGVVPVEGAVGPGCTVAPQPGAYFDSSAGTLVREGEMTPSKDAPEYGDNKPRFKSTVRWDAEFIPLPSNSNDQTAAAREGGLLLSGDVTRLQLYRDEVGGSERQRISYEQGGTLVQLQYGEDGRLFLWRDGAWVSAGRSADGTIIASDAQTTFNGVIAVDGGGIQDLNGGPNVAAEGPAGASIASFAGVTVAASGTVNVTSSLKYTDPPCAGNNTESAPARCENLSARNILGVYSSAGNIDLISPESCGGSCPHIGADPEIHAVMMASQGAVQVRGFDVGPPLGTVNLIGGVIENYYGAFGQFSASGPTHGYGRNFVYDQRTSDGYAPPAFPTQRNWTIELSSIGADAGERVLSKTDDGRGIRLQGDTVSVGRGRP